MTVVGIAIVVDYCRSRDGIATKPAWSSDRIASLQSLHGHGVAHPATKDCIAQYHCRKYA